MEKKLLIALFIGIILGLFVFVVVSLTKKKTVIPGVMVIEQNVDISSTGNISDFEADFYSDLLEYFDGNINVYEQVGGEYGFVNMETLE